MGAGVLQRSRPAGQSPGDHVGRPRLLAHRDPVAKELTTHASPARPLGRQRFVGQIAGLRVGSDTAVVIGYWSASPLGAFTDVMVERNGHRLLIAPSQSVADFVAATYVFDEVTVAEVRLDAGERVWSLTAGPLRLVLVLGPRRLLGWSLRLLPPSLTTSTAFASLADPFARRLMPGVRTRGSAGQGRREWYGAADCHRIAAVRASWSGTDLGALAPVDPPVRFGFGSTPRTPSLTRVTTTVEGPTPTADPPG